ncbi:MAG: hypothetical protein OXF27_10040 [Acidobacteria bacterium]|nr:hypothetical protein [Acidobacteriota bacterium]
MRLIQCRAVEHPDQTSMVNPEGVAVDSGSRQGSETVNVQIGAENSVEVAGNIKDVVRRQSTRATGYL